jgi:hypothetical protein
VPDGRSGPTRELNLEAELSRRRITMG